MTDFDGHQVIDRGRLVEPGLNADVRNWAIIAHLSTIVQPLLAGFPVALVAYLVKKDDHRWLADHTREALNFQITLLIYYVITLPFYLICIGWILTIGVYALGIIGMIRAASAANRGEYHRYPMTIRFVKGPAPAA